MPLDPRTALERTAERLLTAGWNKSSKFYAKDLENCRLMLTFRTNEELEATIARRRAINATTVAEARLHCQMNGLAR